MNRKDRRAAARQSKGLMPAGPGPDENNPFVRAVRHHQAGRLLEAERLYHEVLDIDRRHLGALQYLHDVCGLVRQTGPAEGLWELARSACWMVPHQNICWLIRRPTLIRCDAGGRLHASDGPALRVGNDSAV